LTPLRRSLSIITMRTAATVVLVLVLGACASAAPSSGPGQVLHVVNNSDRAVMVMTGSLLDDSPTTAARPCGGEVALAVAPASYEDDGRLMAMLAIDPNGALDVALKDYEGDPIDMPGSFSASPIWSDGTLDGRLPIYLTVASDLTVTETAAPSKRSTAACVPAY
jgi:hypothetical protein